MKRTVLFPGTFDPFTRGHADLVERALQLFDEVVVAIGYNLQKEGQRSPEVRKQTVQQLYADEPRVRVVVYNDLTVDLALREGAHFILRGVRSMKDYEYERDMADVNKQLGGVETVILFADPQLSSVSSSVVRELQRFGKDVTPYLPEKNKY